MIVLSCLERNNTIRKHPGGSEYQNIPK